MNYEPRSSTRFRVAAWITLAVPIAGFGLVWRIDRSRQVDAPVATPPPSGPFMPKLIDRVRFLPDDAAQIAIAEVKKREGWTGKADPPEREGYWWYVHVWREPRSPEGTRTVVVHSQDGHICDYWARNERP
jgi:hypothetical protein